MEEVARKTCERIKGGLVIAGVKRACALNRDEQDGSLSFFQSQDICEMCILLGCCENEVGQRFVNSLGPWCLRVKNILVIKLLAPNNFIHIYVLTAQ